MTLFTIAGSGFGLYGYLPALIRNGEKVVLPQKYLYMLEARKELAEYSSAVHWVEGQADAFAQAQAIVIARQPDAQAALLRDSISDNIRYLFLEKPLAPDPATAAGLLEKLTGSGRPFRIGYLFLYTTWHASFKNHLMHHTNAGPLSIAWQFTAHHFAHNLQNWKAERSEGGGIIRFYGIHILALLVDCGYNTVESSRLYGNDQHQDTAWEAVFTGPDLPACTIKIDSNASAEIFRIMQLSESITDDIVILPGPFAAEFPVGDNLDIRVFPLMQLLKTNRAEDTLFYQLYQTTNTLWEHVENITEFYKTTH